jgi:hypothetical protein|tara:strand:- start:2076 stop:2288 length:213 start_codon:yes stop_codon:yes gene_type:complete
MSCKSDISTFSRKGSKLYRFPANREEISVNHEGDAVRLTLRFNDQSMSTLLTVADAAELGRLLAAPAAQQ